MNSHHVLIHDVDILVSRYHVSHLQLVLCFNCSLGLGPEVYHPVFHLITISPEVGEP